MPEGLALTREAFRTADVQVLGAEDRAWDEVLGTFPQSDIYYERGYAAACALSDEARARLFVYSRGKARVVLPFLQRPVAPGSNLSDVWSPYGYSGPLATGAGPDDLRASAAAYGSFCRADGVVTSFLRFHPLLATHQTWGTDIKPRFIRHTVGLDLASPEVIDSGLRPECRNKVRRALRAGPGLEVRRWREAGDVFLHLYEVTMRELEAADWYHFPSAYYETLAGECAEEPWVSIVSLDGRPRLAALVLTHRPFAHYHLSGRISGSEPPGLGNYLIHGLAHLAWSLGYAHLHLGGGLKGDDSLYLFTASFNRKSRCDFYAGSWVHLEREFRRLCDRAAARGCLDPDFFPPYRGRGG